MPTIDELAPATAAARAVREVIAVAVAALVFLRLRAGPSAKGACGAAMGGMAEGAGAAGAGELFHGLIG